MLPCIFCCKRNKNTNTQTASGDWTRGLHKRMLYGPWCALSKFLSSHVWASLLPQSHFAVNNLWRHYHHDLRDHQQPLLCVFTDDLHLIDLLTEHKMSKPWSIYLRFITQHSSFPNRDQWNPKTQYTMLNFCVNARFKKRFVQKLP